MEMLWQDLEYTIRGMRRSPGFTAMVVITLALGIGANAAIFSLLDRLFVQSPAGVSGAAHVRRLVQHYHVAGDQTVRVTPFFTNGYLRLLRNEARDGVPAAAYNREAVKLEPKAGAAPDAYIPNESFFGALESPPGAFAEYVVGDYFGVLGARPAAGRFFTADETGLDATTPVVVIGYQLWAERFGKDAHAIGKSIQLDSLSFSIIGVAPRGFHGVDLSAVDLWAPLATSRWARYYHNDRERYESGGWSKVLVRVPSSAVAEHVASLATSLMRQSRRGVFVDSTTTVSLASLGDAVGLEAPANGIAISTRLGGVAGIILVIACANVANLLLARGRTRRREIAVRLALGVSRRRLLSQLLGESVLLAVIGGAAALLIAFWGATGLRDALLPGIRWGESAIGWRLACLTAALALIAGLGAGLVPAVQASSPDLTNALKAGAREGTPGRSRMGPALLVLQTALSIVLLAGAGLFVQSLRNVEGVDTGHDVDRLLFGVVLYAGSPREHAADLAASMPEVAAQLARVSGVERVALADLPPLGGVIPLGYRLFIPDRDSTPRLNGWEPLVSLVSPEHFATVGVRVVRGRAFTANDRQGSEPVAVISGSTARSFWPGENAIGKCVMLQKRENPCRRIVGIVSEAHFAGIIEERRMRLYVPLAQKGIEFPGSGGLTVLEVRADPGRLGAVAAALRKSLAVRFGPAGIAHVRTLREITAPQLRSWRLGAALFSVAGLLALLVAAVGIYTSVSYAVSQRTHEMGVRSALGARAPAIMRLVVSQGVRAVFVGVVIGVGVTLALGRFVASLLYGMTARDPGVLAAVSLTLLVVSVAACLVPARRATRVDPIEALRAE